MPNTNLGILHPGVMGSALARYAIKNGYQPYWVSTGRSAQSRSRATESGISDLSEMHALCRQCDTILAICPSHVAITMANQVAAQNFSGVYIEANAIAPDTSIAISEIINSAGGTYVDASVIGPPPDPDKSTYLLMSGTNLDEVTNVFRHEDITIQSLGHEIGLASAVKMCHTTLKKGSILLANIALTMAAEYDIFDDFVSLWKTKEKTIELSTSIGRNKLRAGKAWRFSSEMLELGKTMEAVGLPDELCQAMSDMFTTIAKNQQDLDSGTTTPPAEFFRSLLKGSA